MEWGTTATASIADKFRESLVKRARKREIVGGEGGWIVKGDQKLGDSYSYYTVGQNGNGKLICSCQNHNGGEFRKVCSHIVGVLLKMEENGFQAGGGQASGSAPLTGDGSIEPATTPSSTSPVQDGAHESTPGDAPRPAPTPEPRLDIPDPRDVSWGSPPLPEWVAGFRDHQRDAIEDVMDAFERGAKVVFMDAPTGSGKTLIAEAVRRKVGGQAIYACTTKTLQDQVIEDYDYAAVLKGRANYATELAPFPDITAADCTGAECNWCDLRCGYIEARNRAQGSRLAVLNTSYLLTAWNGPQTFQGRDLVILDECDLLEGSLMGYVEVRVSEAKQRRYRIGRPEKKTVPASWLEWVERTLPILRRALAAIPEGSNDVKQIREAKWLGGTITNLVLLREGLQGEEVQWVYQLDRDAVVFKPVEVKDFGRKYLWQHGKRFLVMSASIISAAEMAESLGIEDQWEVVKVPTTFPVENRPVHALYAGRVTAKTYDEVIGDVARYVRVIVAAHPDERILVHTVSYKMAADLARKTKAATKRPILTYTNANDREHTLEMMKKTEGAVVFAPSFDRGVDLPGDLCTVQVVAKVPYPYLGDEQVKARLYGTRGGKLWYAVQTVRSLVQMTGRGVRSAEDQCVTYILDRQFQKFYQQNHRLFPDWWSAALDTTGRARTTLGL